MAQLPGAAFIRGRDRIVRIVDAPTRLVPKTFTKNSSTADYESPDGATMLGLKGLVTADYSPVNNNQESKCLSYFLANVIKPSSSEYGFAAGFINPGEPAVSDIPTLIGMPLR